MSYCWIRSKLNYFIIGVVNWEISEKQRKLYLIFYKMFKRIKGFDEFFFSHHVS